MNEEDKIMAFETMAGGAWKYYIPILFFIGTIGNFFSIYVLNRMSRKNSTAVIYLTALVISDEGCLIAFLFDWLYFFGVFDYPKGTCQIVVFCSRLGNFMSVYIVVAFTIERFIAVRFPLLRPSILTISRAKKILIGLLCFGTLLCSYVGWTVNFDCMVYDESQDALFAIEIINTIIIFILPFTSIAVLNVLIVTTLRVSRNDIVIFEHQRDCASMYQKKITTMLFVVSSTFLYLNLPYFTMGLYSSIYPSQDKEETQVADTILDITSLFYATSFGINFFLYCISGQHFRRALLDTISCYPQYWSRRKQRSYISRHGISTVPQSIGICGICLSELHKGLTEIQSEAQDRKLFVHAITAPSSSRGHF